MLRPIIPVGLNRTVVKLLPSSLVWQDPGYVTIMDMHGLFPIFLSWSPIQFKLSTILPTDVTHVINLTGISRLSACTGPGNKAEEVVCTCGMAM